MDLVSSKELTPYISVSSADVQTIHWVRFFLARLEERQNDAHR